MARTSLPRLPPLGRKYRQYLLSFVITLGIGLSPLWGGKFPGFRSILDMFPESLRDVIPWASLLMSVVAVGVQFFGGEKIDARRIARGFMATFVTLVVLTFALYIAYNATVIRVYVPATKTTVAYLVGSTFLPSCECAKQRLDIRDCIGPAITVNPAEVAACYPLQEIRMRKNVLAVLYLLLMFSLGTLIGLLVLKEELPEEVSTEPAPKRRRRKAAAKKSPEA